jgi:glyoxylate/hydroxypyruvate reductase A
MSLLLAMTNWDAEAWRSRFRKELPGEEVTVLGEPFDRRAIHYVASWKHPHGSLAGLPNLAAIFSLGAGVDHLMADPGLPDVPVARVVDPDLTGRMSEYVLLRCLAILRQNRRYQEQQRARIWASDAEQPAARHVRVGILGLGELGCDAAQKLTMVGFQVAGWSRTPKTIGGIESFSGKEGLAPFLARTDILVALLPLTHETRGFVDARLIAGLARDGHPSLGGPHLINAGRGGSQVETDILAALDSGVLASAVLDVFETEPLPQDSPLWSHPRVTITPHEAAMSAPDTVAAMVARQIRNCEAGGALENVVERTRGY